MIIMDTRSTISGIIAGSNIRRDGWNSSAAINSYSTPDYHTIVISGLAEIILLIIISSHLQRLLNYGEQEDEEEEKKKLCFCFVPYAALVTNDD